MRPDPSTAGSVQALCEEGLSLHRQGRVDEARHRYAAVLQRDPRHVLTLRLMGHAHLSAGQAEPAIALLQQALAVVPDDADVHGELGEAIRCAGRPAEALPHLDRALQLAPGAAEVWHNLGLSLATLGHSAEAVICYDRAIALGLALGHAHYNRGVALASLERKEEALAAYDRALALGFAAPDVFNNRGVMLAALRRHDEALASFEKAIAGNEAFADAWANHGTALRELGRQEEALASLERALALQPLSADSWTVAGSIHFAFGRHAKALAYLERALAIDPAHHAARFERSLLHLTLGDFERGWQDYETRQHFWDPEGIHFANQTKWTLADDPRGKHIFVYHEQGLGDSLNFARYLGLLSGLGAQVIFGAQPPLHPVLKRMLPGVALLPTGQAPDHADYDLALLSLPLSFGTTAKTIPPPTPGLTADPARRSRFERLLGPATRPRVGIVWSGNPAHKNDLNRSIPFSLFARLLRPEIDWVVLQPEIRDSDREAFDAFGRASFHGPELNDFGDTAGLCELMDLVISVDTSAAHLVGVMSRPLWLLLPFQPDWRWMSGRDDSPWYPTARLFRQPKAFDWESVIGRLEAELADWLARR